MEEGRLFNNLLSSQPLAFNFFGELACNLPLAQDVLSHFVAMDAVDAVKFEFAGDPERERPDNSAFDVAVLFRRGRRKGLLGIECKYVDSLKSKPYDKGAYKQLMAAPRTFAAGADYASLKQPRFNQLFRNQLIAERLLQGNEFDIAETRLFCHPGDDAIKTAGEFGAMLVTGPVSGFGTITYDEFIAAVQRLDVPWDVRQWTMLLWARYCGTVLSERSRE
jgi:hypothetical protein